MTGSSDQIPVTLLDETDDSYSSLLVSSNPSWDESNFSSRSRVRSPCWWHTHRTEMLLSRFRIPRLPPSRMDSTVELAHSANSSQASWDTEKSMGFFTKSEFDSRFGETAKGYSLARADSVECEKQEKQIRQNIQPASRTLRILGAPGDFTQNLPSTPGSGRS